MELASNIELKTVYRITGTPENFLTALKFGVWGFNEINREKWEKLMPGDLIFFHSKSSDSYFIDRPPSCVIGFGVVGNNFYLDRMPLWIDEFLSEKRYPFRFAFSELYFFYEIPIDDTWESTSLAKQESTRNLIERVLASGIPLSELEGFPHMGSYSAVKNPRVIGALWAAVRPYSYYKGVSDSEYPVKPAELKVIERPEEALRHSTSLVFFNDITQRIIRGGIRQYGVDLASLATAEEVHFGILKYTMSYLRDRGYKILNNNHVDLFAYKGKTSLLIEAKSIENRNFRSQSRKGIIQLFEYNHFEVTKFKLDKSLQFDVEEKLLLTSDVPQDNKYVKFINSLEIKTAAVKENRFSKYGTSINFESL